MFVHSIKLRNLLSFGPDGQELELKPLNVLIGPNGAGKSNLIEAIGLLRSVPDNLHETIVDGGGIDAWVWRGQPKATAGEVEVIVTGQNEVANLHYRLVVGGDPYNAFRVIEERLEDGEGRVLLGTDGEDAFVGSLDRREHRHLLRSMLYEVQRLKCPELTLMADFLASVALFREWSFGRSHPIRTSQQPNLPNKFLLENAQNLGLVLNQLMSEYAAHDELIKSLKAFYEGVTDYYVDIQNDAVKVFLREGELSVPAMRLSDGTLRYLCLLTILCHPTPPPLVCLEEPELGLHPDILPDLVALLRQASERCQLIVTTHSDVVVDALTDTPESVVIVEKHNGATRLKRLDAGDLEHWLEDYRLGELWSSGELGGNRW